MAVEGKVTRDRGAARQTNVDRFPVERFRHAMENRDVEGVVEAWTDDVVCKSLGNATLGFEGKDEARLFIRALLYGCDKFEYTEEIRTDDTLIIWLRAYFGDLSLEGLDILRINEQGQCTEFAVRVRPYMQAALLVGRVAINLTEGGRWWQRFLIGRVMMPPLSWAMRRGYYIQARLQRTALKRALAKGARRA